MDTPNSKGETLSCLSRLGNKQIAQRQQRAKKIANEFNNTKVIHLRPLPVGFQKKVPDFIKQIFGFFKVGLFRTGQSLKTHEFHYGIGIKDKRDWSTKKGPFV